MWTMTRFPKSGPISKRIRGNDLDDVVQKIQRVSHTRLRFIQKLNNAYEYQDSHKRVIHLEEMK